jgi:ABC-2 type transport system ATP-binding protein
MKNSAPVQAASSEAVSGAPILEVQGLTKRYGKKEAVSDISFTVRQPGLIGLLGLNGAGKSSTLRMISGCLAPSAGHIRVMGYDVENRGAAAKSRIGYLPETAPLYPDLTVREYLRFARGLRNARRSGAGQSASNIAWMESLVRDLEIESVMPRLIRSLSKGFRQRVGIAAALAGRPALLLLDEPASGLDPRQAADFRSLLLRLSTNMAIIVSSHVLSEISSLCSRIIIIKQGRIAADESPDKLVNTGGSRKTHIEARGNLGLAEQLVQACAGAVRVDLEEAGSTGHFTVFTGGGDFREQVFRAFAARSDEVALNALWTPELSLEEVFIDLTN